MAEIKVQADFAAKTAAVWEKLADFGGLDGWMPGVESCEIDKEGVGGQRTLSMGPMKVVERLEKLDPATCTLAYSIVEGPMPVQNYLATITVSETGAESCHVDWIATFDLPEGLSADKIAPAMEGAYGGALGALKSQLEG